MRVHVCGELTLPFNSFMHKYSVLVLVILSMLVACQLRDSSCAIRCSNEVSVFFREPIYNALSVSYCPVRLYVTATKTRIGSSS